MRLYRLIGKVREGKVEVFADVAGMGRRPVRVKLGNLSEKQAIETKIETIRKAATLRQAVREVGGM